MLLIWPSPASRTSRNKTSLTDAGVEPEDPLPVYAGVGLSGSRGRAGAEVAQLRAQDTQHGASALGCGACAAAGVAVHGARLLVELEAVSGRGGRVGSCSGLVLLVYFYPYAYNYPSVFFLVGEFFFSCQREFSLFLSILFIF